MTAPLSPVEDAELIERAVKAMYFAHRGEHQYRPDHPNPDVAARAEAHFASFKVTEDYRRMEREARAALQALPRYGEMKKALEAIAATVVRAIRDGGGSVVDAFDEPVHSRSEMVAIARAALNNGEEE